MPRDITATLRAAIFAQETGEALLTLLQIDHAELATPIRIVDNNEDIWSNGLQFFASAFKLGLPDDVADTPPQITLMVCNVDRAIVQALDDIASSPTVTLWLALASSPDDYEVDGLVFSVIGVRYDVLVIQATLGFEPIMQEAFPKDSFDPQTTPELF
jgi:hypothetical protein